MLTSASVMPMLADIPEVREQMDLEHLTEVCTAEGVEHLGPMNLECSISL